MNVAAPAGETLFNENAGRPGCRPRRSGRRWPPAPTWPHIQKVATADKGGASTGHGHPRPRSRAHTDTVTGNLPAYDADKAKSVPRRGRLGAPASDGIRAKDGKKLTIKFIYLQQRGAGLTAAAELLAAAVEGPRRDVTLEVDHLHPAERVLFASGTGMPAWIPLGVNLPSQLVPLPVRPGPTARTSPTSTTRPTPPTPTKAAATGDVDQACALWNAAETALFKAFDVVPMFDRHVDLPQERDGDDHRRRALGASLRLTTG